MRLTPSGHVVGVGAFVVLGALACSKSDATKTDGRTTSELLPVPASASAPEAGSANSDASTSADALAPSSGNVGATAGPASTFVATYTISPAPMYVPPGKDYASVKFKNDEAKHLGDGNFTFVIDESGRLSGASEGGPLGSAILDGHAEGNHVAATIRRKDATDEGLWGTLVGTVEADTVSGTMRLSEWNAAAVREAKFTGKKSK